MNDIGSNVQTVYKNVYIIFITLWVTQNETKTRVHNIIQLLVFEETNIKIYWCVKGDVDRLEAEVNISFHTPITLYIGLFKHQLLFYYFFCVKRLVDNVKKRGSDILNLE